MLGSALGQIDHQAAKARFLEPPAHGFARLPHGLDAVAQRYQTRSVAAQGKRCCRNCFYGAEEDAGVTIVPLGRYSSWQENPRIRIEHLGFPDGRREIDFMENERKRQLTSHLRHLLIELSRDAPS
jgi:hypothetical protein